MLWMGRHAMSTLLMIPQKEKQGKQKGMEENEDANVHSNQSLQGSKSTVRRFLLMAHSLDRDHLSVPSPWKCCPSPQRLSCRSQVPLISFHQCLHLYLMVRMQMARRE